MYNVHLQLRQPSLKITIYTSRFHRMAAMVHRSMLSFRCSLWPHSRFTAQVSFTNPTSNILYFIFHSSPICGCSPALFAEYYPLDNGSLPSYNTKQHGTATELVPGPKHVIGTQHVDTQTLGLITLIRSLHAVCSSRLLEGARVKRRCGCHRYVEA